MMVFLLNVADNGRANDTSIDAIAYVNRIGLKIYQPDRAGGLRLAHQYIPQAGAPVKYLYHEGIHFQKLLPQD